MSLSRVLIRAFFILGALLAILFTVLWVNFAGQINTEFRESIPYKLSVEFIKNDESIKEVLGDNYVFGKNIGGYLKPLAEARFVFKVRGDKSSVRAICILNYISEEWVIDSITYE